MNPSVLLILFVFVLSVVATVLRGPCWTFVTVYLPTLLMFSQLPQLLIPHIPMVSYFAPIMGILIGWPFSKQSAVAMKWNLIDVLVILTVISSCITVLNVGEFESGVNAFRNEMLRFAAPYFLARITFRATDMRRLALNVLIMVLAVTGVLALIECRLQPMFYLRLLKSFGFGVPIHPMSMMRFGFFRVFGTAEHPIYFGNMCVVLLGLVAVLAKTSGVSLKNIWVALALFTALSCVGVSISFGPYMGLMAGIAIFVMFMLVKPSRYLAVPLTVAVIAAVFAFTYHVAHTPLGEKGDGDLSGSYYTRKLIIVESWKKAATAGAFGYGPFLTSDDASDDFDLSSVDNSYMLFTMTHGWIYTSIWLLMAVSYSYRLTRGFMRVKHPSQVFPLAASSATIFAILISMNTVWAGAVYVLVWVIMLGLSNTLIDLVLYPELRIDEIAAVKRRGVTTVRSGRPGGLAMPGLQMAQVSGPIGRR